MSCTEILPVIQDFVDHELDTQDMERVTRHVGECRDCASRVTTLRDLKACLRRHARADRAPAGLVERIGRNVRREARGTGLRWLPLAAAAALLFGLGTLFGLWLQPAPSVSATELARNVVYNHLELVNMVEPQMLSTSNCKEVEQYFARNLVMRMDLPGFETGAVTLRGGRCSKVMGQCSSVVFYEYMGMRMTMFVLQACDVDTPALDRAIAAAQDQIICLREEYRDYQVLCWKRDGLLFAMVAEAKTPDIDDLIVSAYMK